MCLNWCFVQILASSVSDVGSTSVLSQLCDLVQSQGSPGADLLPLSALLTMCIATFSLLGEACIEKQMELDQLKVYFVYKRN